MYFNPKATSTPRKAQCSGQNSCGTGFNPLASSTPRKVNNYIDEDSVNSCPGFNPLASSTPRKVNNYTDEDSLNSYSGSVSPDYSDEESLNSSIRFSPAATSTPRKVKNYPECQPPPPRQYQSPMANTAPCQARLAYSDRRYAYPTNAVYPTSAPARYQPRLASPSPHYQNNFEAGSQDTTQYASMAYEEEAIPDYGGSTPTHYSNYSTWTPSRYENHPVFIAMEQKFADYEKRMLQRHIAELRRDPTNENIKLKHKVEQSEFDCIRMKNRLKLEYRLDHEINQNISDEEVFGQAFIDPKMYHPPDIQPLYTSPNISPIASAPRRACQEAESTSKDSCNVCGSSEKKFLSELGLIVMQILIRRKLMKKCLNEYVKSVNGKMNCHELKRQKNAQDQFLQFLEKETLTIYNDLIKYVKSDQNEDVKKQCFANYKKATHLSDHQKQYGKRIASVMLDFIKEYVSREAAMQEQFEKMKTNCECTQKIDKYEKEMLKATSKLLKGFSLLWSDFEEEEKSNSGPIRLNSSIAAAIGKTLLEIFKMQHAANDEYIKKFNASKGAISTKIQLSDMEELDHVHMIVVNDIWDSMLAITKLLEYKDSTPTFTSNCYLAFEAMLALYKKYHPLLEDKIEEHCNERQDTENDSEDPDSYWQDLRQELNNECHEVAASLDDQNTDQRTCQEQRLKEQQVEEVNEIREKYRKIIESHPCNAQQYEYLFSGELAELDAKHVKQWDEFIESKLRYKINQIEEADPKDTESTCNEACGTLAENKPIKSPCNVCSNPSLDQEQVITMHCPDSNPHMSKPNLTQDLEIIEEQELQELQYNLKKWQQARRKCIETINSLKK